MSRSIAMVVASPFPANHGTPGSIKELTEAMAEAGDQVHVVTYHFGVGTPPKGVTLHRIPDWGFSRKVVVGPTVYKPFLDLLMVFTLCRVIWREGIELIHAHNYEGALIGYLASLLTRRPLVYHAMNTMSDELPSYNFFRPPGVAIWLAKHLDYWVPRMATRIIAISQELANFLYTQGIAPSRIQVIPPGIDTTQFRGHNRSLVRQCYQLGEARVVMYTGILDRFQRLDYLLQAMRLVLVQVPSARLLLVTNLAKDRDWQECNAMVQELGLTGHVDIIQHDSFADIPHFLAAADVAVVCRPHCPGFPIKLLNYMAAEKPIVASVGSAKGLQHLQEAFVVPDHDWRAMGHGIVTVLQNQELAASLGRKARTWVDTHYAWPSLIKTYDMVYAAALAR